MAKGLVRHIETWQRNDNNIASEKNRLRKAQVLGNIDKEEYMAAK